MAETGKRLRWAREIVAESQADLCRRLGGIETSTWNRWERGHRYPDPVEMVRLCEMFGLTMDYLYRGRLSGVREDIAFRLLAHHPELLKLQPEIGRLAKSATQAA